MCGVSLLARTCRVCLASSGEMYRLANTALEETYERVTSGTLVVEGRPCCVCGVCLSALRRCRRFIDTAREANDALDRYQPNTDTVKLTERPLFTFTQTPTQVIDTTRHEGIWESRGKVDGDSTGDIDIEDDKPTYQKHEGNSEVKGNVLKKEIKIEITSDVEGCTSEVLPHFECINIQQEMLEIEIDTTALDDVKHNISEVLDDVGGDTAPGTSSVESPRSRKRVKKEDTESGPALKKRRPITSEHRRGNTDPAAALHSVDNTFTCHECNFKTPKQIVFKQHLKIHTGLKPFACNKCDYKSSRKNDLKQHLMIHTGEKPFACDKCDFKCSKKSTLKQHSSIHSVERPFACDQCDYTTKHKRNLKLHTLIHSVEKPFACDQCDYKTSKKCNLKKHLLSHTDEKGKKMFACDLCSYSCCYKESLILHLKTHTGEKPFTCDMCDYKCIQKGSLKLHIRTHTGEKPFSCDKCDYKSRVKINLKEHLKTHSSEKMFMCHLCGLKSSYENNLKRHIRKHTGEKPFACDKCDYKSIQRSVLKLHMLTHTGEKRFTCDGCDYRCNDRRSMGKHIMRVHGGSTLVPKRRALDK